MLRFPQETHTHTHIVFGTTVTNVETYTGEPLIVLAISMQQEKDLSETTVLCGTEVLAKNYSKDFPQVFFNYICEDDITIDKTGNDEAFVSIQVLHSASTTPFYYNGFSYDGIFIGLVLFLMFMVMFFGGIWNRVDGVRKRKASYNQFMGNNSEEGKIIYYD